MAVQYIPLYRKYRPKTFSELVGQEIVVQTFHNALDSNKIVHAYLFCGPRGTGKTSTARILAKSLNCKQGPTFNPCGTCDNCIEISNSSSIDVIEIDAASHGGVEDARHIVERVQYPPVVSKYKIFIIDEVHMLSTAAFNVLLKTLEEPPESYVFILATTEPHKLLNTIISRCQRFDFRRIDTESLITHLTKVADIESIKIDTSAVKLIARRSSGGLRDALGLLDQVSVISLSGKTISSTDITKFTGAIPEDLLLHLVSSIGKKDPHQTLEHVRTLIDQGNEPTSIIKDLTMLLRNLLIIKATGSINNQTATLINASQEIFQDLEETAKIFDPSELSEMIFKTSTLERQIKYSNQPYLWLEVGLISLCYRFEINALTELNTRLNALETQAHSLISGIHPATPALQTQNAIKSTIFPSFPETSASQKETPTSITSQPSSNIPSPLPPSIKENENTWKALLDAISHPPTKGILNSGGAPPMSITREEAVICMKSEIFIEQISDPKRKIHIEQALHTVFGVTPPIRFVLSTSSPEHPQEEHPREKPFAKKKNQTIKPEIPSTNQVLNKEASEEDSPQDLYKKPQDPLPDSANMVLNIFKGKLLDQDE